MIDAEAVVQHWEGCSLTVYHGKADRPDVWTETILYAFQDNGQDGNGPLGGLIMDRKGGLYGTTQVGGATNHGTVFKLTPPKTAVATNL